MGIRSASFWAILAVLFCQSVNHVVWTSSMCDPDFVADRTVMNIEGDVVNPCRQRVFRDVKVEDYTGKTFTMPIKVTNYRVITMSGTVENNGVFIVSLKDKEGQPLSNMVAMVMAGRVILESYEDGERVGYEMLTPSPFPFHEGKDFQLVMTLSGNSLKYEMCSKGDDCVALNQSMANINVHTVFVAGKSNIDMIDLVSGKLR